MDALVSMAGGVAAGYAAEHLGYGVFFTAASLIALVTIPAIAMVTGRPAQPAPASPNLAPVGENQ